MKNGQLKLVGIIRTLTYSFSLVVTVLHLILKWISTLPYLVQSNIYNILKFLDRTVLDI